MSAVVGFAITLLIFGNIVLLACVSIMVLINLC